jgi:NitT/TauT family transport system substrate-binding protein
MKKNSILMSLIVIMTLLLMTACGQSTDENVYSVEDNEATVDETEVDEPDTNSESSVESSEVDADEGVEATPIRIATLAGPTGMGLIQIVDDESLIYETEIYTAPDQIVPKIISGEVDIASIPSNLAALLYQKTGGNITNLSLNVSGVLYIVENGDTIESMSDLEGKTIYATGQGSSPEYILTHILEENGLIIGENVEVEYLMAHADLANMVAAGEVEVAMLPEPYVSVVMAQNSDINVQIDFNEEWQEIYGTEQSLPMGVTIVNNAFLEENPEAVAQFIEDYKASVAFVTESMDEASELIAEHGIISSAAVAKSAIPKSNISYIEGEKAMTTLNQYFEILFNSNPESIGGSMPDESFYFIP